MPRVIYLLLIFHISNLALASSEDTGRFRSFIGWCGRILTSLSRKAPFRKANTESPTLFQSFVATEAKQIGHLSNAELEQLVQLSKISNDDAHILAMLQQYTGPREKLPDLLQWHLDKLGKIEKAQDVFDPIPEILSLSNCPSCAGVKERWKQHVELGWKAVFAPERLAVDSNHAQVFPKEKLIAFRRAPSDEPLPLTAAEEVLHIDALNTVDSNKEAVRQWTREVLGEVVFAEELKGVDRTTRYHWSFVNQYYQLLKKLPDAEVNKAILFLIERDAMAKKLEIYRELIKSHPEFKTKVWDEIAASSYPIAKISGILNRQNRFQLNPKFVENLGEHLLDEIVRGRGGETVTDREQRQAKEKTLPTIIIPPNDEIYRSTPGVLREPFGTRADYQHWDKIAKELTEDQAQKIVAFLQKPWSAEVAKLGLKSEAYNALNVLNKYDKAHDTDHTIKGGIAFLKALRPTQDPNDFQYTWSWVLNAVEIGSTPNKNGKIPHPAAIKEFFDALQQSPILKDFSKNHNSGTDLGRILKLAKNLPADLRPNPAHILVVVNANVAALEAEAIGSRDYNQFNLRSFAQFPAEQARDYFLLIGEKEKADYLDRVVKRLQEGMDRYQRNDPYRNNK